MQITRQHCQAEGFPFYSYLRPCSVPTTGKIC